MDKFDYSCNLNLEPNDSSFINISIISTDYDLLGVSNVVSNFIDCLKDYLRGIE